MAVKKLRSFGHAVIAVGLKSGIIDDTPILSLLPESIDDLDSITLYMNEHRQEPYIQKLLSLHPKRIIFNPGAENEVLAKEARSLGIETVEGCTLVMLSLGTF